MLGVHEGIIHYTVGQRRGLKVSSNQGRLYVREVCPQENRVVLSDNQALFHRGLTGKELNLIPTGAAGPAHPGAGPDPVPYGATAGSAGADRPGYLPRHL